jgi:hypothetical protein
MAPPRIPPGAPPDAGDLQSRFLELLPRLRTHAAVYFRHIPCPGRRADCVAEATALGWQWFVRLARRGRDARQFPMAFAGLLARAVRSGRRLCGGERTQEVLSPVAQRRHGFAVEGLPSTTRAGQESLYARPRGQQLQDLYEERLHANTLTPPDEQAMFRIDFADWLDSLTARERCLLRAMALNERTADLAQRFGLSPGRISQMRREFERGWRRFCGDDIPAGGPRPTA